jgi:hypothetical protein
MAKMKTKTKGLSTRDGMIAYKSQIKYGSTHPKGKKSISG